jgi:hypothetical protein
MASSARYIWTISATRQLSKPATIAFRVAKRMPHDWERPYAYRPFLLETFIEIGMLETLLAFPAKGVKGGRKPRRVAGRLKIAALQEILPEKTA